MSKIDLSNISLKDFAGYISTESSRQKINAVLVGGACVTIYSKERYLSYDLDFATHEDIVSLEKALKCLGFTNRGKYFKHEECKWVIEFVPTPIAVGDELLDSFVEYDTTLGKVQLLRPEDCVKDRLASYFHWDDQESLTQAVQVCLETSVDLKEIKAWAKREKKLYKV
ncbi:MAG: hypothetical protein ChlgKO_12580 [Chlamydiales bacterium]